MVKIDSKESFAALPPTQRATAFVLSPDPKGKNFLYCVGNGVVIRDIAEPKNHDIYTEHQKPATCAKYSKTGFYICSGDQTGKVRIWDTTQEEHILKCEYQPMSGEIRDIAWDPDSKRIAVCGNGKGKYAHAFMWDTGSSVGSLDTITKSANSVDFKPNRPYRCVVASEDFKTYIYEGPPFKFSKTLAEGTRFANCVRFSPDGKYFASANSDGNIYLCDGKTGEYIGKFGDPKSHNGGVYSICFSPDGSEMLSASADKTCKIWNVESREAVVQFEIGKTVDDQQLSCLWQGDYLLSVSLSGDINYLDRNNPSTPTRVVTGHKNTINSVVAKPNEAIFSASFEGSMVRWNPQTGDAIRFKGKGHGTKITSMTFSACNNEVISVGLDNSVRFTNADTCDFSTGTSVALDSEPSCCALTDDGSVVVACEKELVLIKNGKKACVLPWKATHPAKIGVAGARIVASGELKSGYMNEGQSGQVYEIQGDAIVATDVTFDVTKSIDAISCSADGSKVALSDAKTIHVYELCDGFEKPKKLNGHNNTVGCLSWSPDNQHLASGGVDSSVIVWDAASGSKDNYIGAHPKKVVYSVTWLNENTIVSAGEDCTVKQWSVSY